MGDNPTISLTVSFVFLVRRSPSIKIELVLKTRIAQLLYQQLYTMNENVSMVKIRVFENFWSLIKFLKQIHFGIDNNY